MANTTQAISSSNHGPLDTVSDAFQSVVEGIKSNLEWLDDKVERLTENLPSHIQTVAIKVYRSIFDTLFCLAIISGVATVPCMIYWSARMIYISIPSIKTLLVEEWSLETFGKARQEFLANLHATYRHFCPALGVSSFVAACLCYTVGFLTFNPMLTVRGTLFSINAQVCFYYAARDI